MLCLPGVLAVRFITFAFFLWLDISMISGVSADAIREQADETAPHVLALDIGTSSVRAALFDKLGNEIKGTAVRLTRTFQPTLDGGAELDADEAVEQVTRTVDGVLAKAAPSDVNIKTIAVSCFWHSLVGMDGEGRAVTPVLGWADTRAAQAAEALRREFDERLTHARTGCRFHPSYWPAKLRWLQQEQDALYRSVHRWMSFGELLALRFYGEAETSVSMASATGLLDVRLCQWDGALLKWLGISDEQLPAIAQERKSFGVLTEEYARRWPQLSRARLFPAIGDGAANNIGAGCVTRERVALMIGTSGAMRALSEDEPPGALPAALWCYRATRRRILVGGALSDGGGLYDWMTKALNLGSEREAIEEALAAIEPDAHGLTVLPFWAGERSIGWHSHARGAILGLTMHTRPIEILRAAMEGVAYRFALIADALDQFAPAAMIVASGGAIRASPVWTQMLADVLGRPITLLGVREASSRGAVLLALEATGELNSIAEAPSKLDQVYEPDVSRHARYRAALERQQERYEQVVSSQ
jgi:gluconokinase